MADDKFHTPQLTVLESRPTDENAKQDLFIKRCISITPELRQKVQEMLASTRHPNLPQFWKLPYTEEIYVPVRDGEIRVLHVNPPNKISKRPLVLVPGWGGVPNIYMDSYDALHNNIEFYYVETREKHTSRIHRWRGKFTMSQKAEDLGSMIKHLNLDRQDFILLGACWGSAIILQGLMDGTLDAPTIVTFDPMNKIWYSRFVLGNIAPLLPAFFIDWLKPFFRWQKVRTIKEEVQARRSNELIEKAEIWKWKKTGIQAKDFFLLGRLHKITREVIVVNGTVDTIHDKTNYPKMARELPRGRFLYLETDENQRERLLGLVGREFAKVTSGTGVPSSFLEFEKEIIR